MSDSKREKTYDYSLSTEARTTEYRFLEYHETQTEVDRINKVAGEILSSWLNAQFSGADRTRKEWEKEKNLLEYTFEGKSYRFRARDFFRQKIAALRRDRDWAAVSLPPVDCWLDSGVAMVVDTHAPCNEDETESMTFVSTEKLEAELPRQVHLDREGAMFTSMLAHLEQTILRTRDDVVVGSDALLKLGKRDPEKPNFTIAARQVDLKAFSIPWLNSLTTYITSIVSMVEITLYLIYYRAMFAPPAGWKFDPETLGGPVNRRLPDKIGWVHAITGEPLDDIARGYGYLQKIKRVRNHLSHFDPAVFAFSIEDLAEWMNSCGEIADLVWRLRRKARLPVSSGLAGLLLVRKVRHVPRDPKKKRPKQPENFGYASCDWRTAFPHGASTWYLIRFSKSEGWVPGRTLDEQSNWRMHKLYWMRLINERFLSAAVGDIPDAEELALPFALIEAPSLDHAKNLAEGDPIVKSGVLRVDVLPWGTRIDTLHR